MNKKIGGDNQYFCILNEGKPVERSSHADVFSCLWWCSFRLLPNLHSQRSFAQLLRHDSSAHRVAYAMDQESGGIKNKDHVSCLTHLLIAQGHSIEEELRIFSSSWAYMRTRTSLRSVHRFSQPQSLCTKGEFAIFRSFRAYM